MIFDIATSPATNFLMPLDLTYSSTHCLTLYNGETIQEKRGQAKRSKGRNENKFRERMKIIKL